MLLINKLLVFVSISTGIIFFPIIANSFINSGTSENKFTSNPHLQNIIPVSLEEIQKIKDIKKEKIFNLAELIIRHKAVLKSSMRNCTLKERHYNDCFFLRSYSNGDKYYGEFQNNRRHGVGYYIYKNGTSYLGNWVNGVFNGEGTLLYSKSGSFSGQWRNGKRKKGTEIYKSGGVYKGQFFNNRRHGKGLLKYNNGDIYEGIWENDKKSGEGIFTYKSGETAKGFWRNDKLISTNTSLASNTNLPVETQFLQGFLSGKLSGIAYNEEKNKPKLFSYNNRCDFEAIKGISKKYLNPIVIHQINGRLLKRFVVINPQNSKEIIQKAYINSRSFPFNFKYKIQRTSDNKLFFDMQDSILNESQLFKPILWWSSMAIEKIERNNFDKTYPSILVKTFRGDNELYLSNLRRFFGQPIGKIISYWSDKRIKYEFNRILLSGVQKYRNGDSRQSSSTTSSKIYYCPTDKVNILLEEYRKNLIPKLKSANQLRYASLKKQDEMDKKQRLEEQQKRKKRLAERKKKEKERERKTTQRGGWKCISYVFSTKDNTKYCLASCSKPGVRVPTYGLWKTINKFQKCGLVMGHLPSGSVSGIGTWEGPRWR